MTALLTIIIVLFVAVALWQMVKIFDLAQVGSSNTQIADDNDNRLNGYLMMGFLLDEEEFEEDEAGGGIVLPTEENEEQSETSKAKQDNLAKNEK